ncbi:hypothetical protein [Actinoplanes sp. NPDC051494]|uniref:hypothetical protein n=1 Tax=Actinoplanes sp. NPDC051494 TaxID=3363907 RepID=UPI0037AD694C
MLFRDGLFAPDKSCDASTAAILFAATDRAAVRVHPGDILHVDALLRSAAAPEDT